MFKKILIIIMIILMVIGISIGIYFACNDNNLEQNPELIDYSEIFKNVQAKKFELNEFYTYGRALNISGTLEGIKKDNFENVKLFITDGKGFEKNIALKSEFDGDKLVISSAEKINSGLILDDLDYGNYIILIRLKLNNSVNPRYYSIEKSSNAKKIEYYSISRENKNKKINIIFEDYEYNENKYTYLGMKVEDSELPDETYDIVIDASHGGKDTGEKSELFTEANLTLQYSELLKSKLEENGLKVKLTRTKENDNTFTARNMYDDNGRISIACKTNAKLMISLHVNSGNSSGVEVYCPCKSDLNFAEKMAQKINLYTGIGFSNNNSYKKSDGVYVQNFTENLIYEFAQTAEKSGYAPYNITTETPYLYTIREVGGIATNAYADGRNTKYSANKYYKSNQGIECYQIEMGYIKNDGQLLMDKKNEYVTAICDAILQDYLK